MTTRDFAIQLIRKMCPRCKGTIGGPCSFCEERTGEIYRSLLYFLKSHQDGYGVALGDGERGEARAFAEEFGYYWIPCILCSTWYGGQEANAVLMLDGLRGIAVCASCGEEAARLNSLYPNGILAEEGKND